MDVVLNKMGNQPDLKHIEGLFDAIQKAKNALQMPPSQSSPYEKRRKCIECFRLALASARPKFATIAFEGVQFLLRDHGLLGAEEQSPEGETRSGQLLWLFSHIPSWREVPATQCQSLTVLVQLISSTDIPVQLGDVINAIEICKRTFDSAVDDTTSVRPAARAALTQILNSYVQNRLSLGECGDSMEIGAAMDVTALLGELITRMGSAMGELAEITEKSPGAMGAGSRPSASNRLGNQPLLLPLDALFSVLSALDPSLIVRHFPLLNLLKNELIPVVICHLHGSAKCTGVESNNSKTISTLMGTLKRAGRGISTDNPSGIVPVAKALEGAESTRSFYQVIDQLMRLFSPIVLSSPSASSPSPSTPSPPSFATPSSGLLPLLEELWRCALLAPPLPKRSESLRLAKRICGQRIRFGELVKLSVASGRDSFWLVLVQCVEECGTSGAEPAGADQQRMAADALRTLVTMFLAISQLIATQPNEFDADFADDHLFTQLTISEENASEAKDVQRNNGFSAEMCKSHEKHTEKAAQMFVDAFVGQIQGWERTQVNSNRALDTLMQELAARIFTQLKGLLLSPAIGMGRERRRRSSASTPEDSGEEEEEGGSGEEEEVPTGVEVFGMVAELVRRMDTEGGGNWARVRSGGAQAQHISGDVAGPGPSHHLPPPLPPPPLFPLVLHTLHHLHPDFFLTSSHQKVLSPLRLSASDPLSLLPLTDRHRLLLISRWFCRQIHNCWSSFVRIFTQNLTFGTTSSSVTTEEAKCATVETLAVLVPLAIELGLSTELQWIFEHIGERMCVLEELRETIRRTSSKRLSTSEDPRDARRFCGRPEMMAIQAMMENGLGALIIAPRVAKHIVRCVQFLWELERWHFKLAKSTIEAIYEPPSLPIPPSPSGQHSPIGQLIGCPSPGLNELSSTEVARLMDEFLTLIDRLFSNATQSLPLDSFCAFLRSICAANEDNLHYSAGLAPAESSAQLLQRLCQLLVGMGTFAPLMHKVDAWSQVQDHLIQCASAASIPPEINRRAVDGLHEVIGVFLHREWQGSDCLPVPGGWNSLLFGSFSQIVLSKCSPETCQQIGQVLLAFVENAELVGSGWPQLFAATKQTFERSTGELADPGTPTSQCAAHSVALCLDILDKFLAIPKSAVLLCAFSDFSDALAHFISLSLCSGNEPTVFDRLLLLLERSQKLLLGNLYGATIPAQLIAMTDRELEREWHRFIGTLKSDNGREKGTEDHLQLLIDLKTVLIEQQRPLARDPMQEWLDGSDDKLIMPELTTMPWHHLPPSSASRTVALHAFRQLRTLWRTILDTNNPEGASHRSRLTLNTCEFVTAIAAKIGVPFATFCLCAIPLSELRKSIVGLLTVPAARSLKQLIGITSSHQSMIDQLHQSDDSDLWSLCLLHFLLELAIRCVAKGGTLSLAGCALIRRVCAVCDDQSLSSRALCANALWQSTRYALFPIRMLISQFFAHSTDFSGDLGQMRVSYRLGLSPSEVEERVDNVRQLANEVFHLEEQQRMDQRKTPNDARGQAAPEKGRRESAGGAHFPSKFAYLFIFEGGTGKSGDSKKLSMGMDELVDSLHCQQLLISLASEELCRQSPWANSIHGPLLASLNGTLAVCEQFELRPGLKSLLQKLAGMTWPANLWKLAVPCLNTLIRWHLCQAIAQEKDDDRRRTHLRRIGGLLRRVGTTKGRDGAEGGGGEDQKQKGEGGKEDRRMSGDDDRRGPTPRANPFMSLDTSRERLAEMVGRGEETAEEVAEEDNRVRSFAFAHLLGRFNSDVLRLLSEVNITDTAGIVKELLAEIEQMKKELLEERNEHRKSRELLEELAKKLELKVVG